MEWLIALFTTTDSIAHIALLYAIVIAVGVYLGKIKLGGISLGVTFVLFAGIAGIALHSVDNTVFALLHNAHMVRRTIAVPVKKDEVARRGSSAGHG